MQVLTSTVDQFLDSIGRSSKSTKECYKIGLEHFSRYLAANKYSDELIRSIKMGEINVYELLNGFVSFLMQRNLSIPSVKMYVASVKSYLEFSDIDIVASKFRRQVKLPKHYREDELPLDMEDIRNILLKCHNRRLKAYLLVLASSGMRAMEACTLRIKDVDMTADGSPTRIHIRKEFSKTRRAREVYITDEATKYLRDLINSKKDKGSDYLIFTKGKSALSRSVYFRLLTEFEKLLETVGMNERKENSIRRKITLHSFRRYVKGVVSDQAGSDYSEWFLGHDHSVYWTRKEPERRKIYATKCMHSLTVLDYTELDTHQKNIQSELKVKDKQIQELMQFKKEMQEAYEEINALLKSPEKLSEMLRS